MGRNLHERFDSLDEPDLPSDRSFGYFFAVLLASIALYPLLRGGRIQLYALLPSAALFLAAWLAPRSLHGLNAVWMRLGRLLGSVTNPLICGLIFYAVFLPLGIILRLSGRLAMAKEARVRDRSSWIPRSPPGPDPSTMRNQF